MSEDDSEEGITGEQRMVWRQRAGNVMIGHYAVDEGVNIYGLTLNRVSGNSEMWHVYEEVGDEHRYIDTLNVSQFPTATQLINQLISYYPNEQEAESMEPKEETEDSMPQRSIQ